MKKVLSIIMSMIFMMSMVTACSAADDSAETKTEGFVLAMQIGNSVMTVNGTEKPIDEQGTAPVIVGDRTLLPVRAVVEEMGGTVSWNEDTKEVTLRCASDEIKLTIDSKSALLNGEEKKLDVAPTIINGRTMLPIRFIAESFRFDVAWDGAAQTVTITKAEAAENPAVQPSEEPETKKLVVYFSATGSTKKAAEYIAKAAGADLFEIEPAAPYTSADLNWNDSNSRVSKEHDNPADRAVELKSSDVPNWEQYDTVWIGYPIWWGIAAWPVNSFVQANDFTGKTVIPFCTSASSSLGESGKLLATDAETGTWLDGVRFSSGVSEETVTEWVKNIDK